MEDGSISTIEITLTAWLNRDHVKAAETAVENAAKKIAEEAAAKAAMEAKEKYLARFTPEEIEEMSKLGMFKG